MRIINEILLKILEKLMKNNFLKSFRIFKNLLNIRDKLSTLLNIRVSDLLMIRYEILKMRIF